MFNFAILTRATRKLNQLLLSAAPPASAEEVWGCVHSGFNESDRMLLLFNSLDVVRGLLIRIRLRAAA